MRLKKVGGLDKIHKLKETEIIAPLMSLSKPEIAKEAYRLGIRQGDTWSCYRPQTTDNGFEPCGQCDACVLHKYAWEHIDD